MIQEKKKYHHGDLKGQLVEAVRQLIEQEGPEGWSIAEACRLAGVSTAAPYRHFRDRDEIMRHVVVAAMGRLGERMDVAMKSHAAGDPERVVALGRAYIGFAADEPGVFRIMFSLTEGHEGDQDIQAMGQGARSIVETVVAEHLGIDPNSQEAVTRAYALWCFVHGHSFLRMDAKAKVQGLAVPEDVLLRLIGEAMVPTPDRDAASDKA